MKNSKSAQLLKNNAKYIPGGLASINRLTDPALCFKKADGAYVWDLDGKKYIDYHAAFAPMILGHNDPDIEKAVLRSYKAKQSLYGAGGTAEEGELAKLFLKCLPYAEKVQFLNTGSEASAQAIRVARAQTGKDHVIIMQGGYNGNHNMVSANLMNSKADLGKKVSGDEYPIKPITAGIPAAEKKLMHPVEFNDLKAVEKMIKKHPIAAIILEPVLQNVGIVKPLDGYLKGLRKLADKHKFLLIFDEVKTGFRAGRGGYQGVSKVVPDLSVFGKAFANGYPISALAGKAKYMDLAITGNAQKRVLIAGTYNCHPVTVAAATACLKKLSSPKIKVYQKLEGLAKLLEKGQKELFKKHGIPVTICRVGSASCVYFMDKVPTSWWDIIENHDFDFDVKYRLELIKNGVFQFPVACKQGSISFAHTQADIEKTLKITDKVLKSIR